MIRENFAQTFIEIKRGQLLDDFKFALLSENKGTNSIFANKIFFSS